MDDNGGQQTSGLPLTVKVRNPPTQPVYPTSISRPLPTIGIAPEAQMPFFRTYAFHLDNASLEKYCRPADFFACDTLMQEEVGELGVPHANKTCEQDLQTLKPSANHQPSPFKLERG